MFCLVGRFLFCKFQTGVVAFYRCSSEVTWLTEWLWGYEMWPLTLKNTECIFSSPDRRVSTAHLFCFTAAGHAVGVVHRQQGRHHVETQHFTEKDVCQLNICRESLWVFETNAEKVVFSALHVPPLTILLIFTASPERTTYGWAVSGVSTVCRCFQDLWVLNWWSDRTRRCGGHFSVFPDIL